MKKTMLIAFLLVLLLTVCGCGSETQAPAAPPAEESQGTAAGTPEDVNSDELPEQAAPESLPEPVSSEPPFTEQTLMDNELCSIVITGIDPDSIFGYTLKASIENKSPDKNLTVSVVDSSVNGIKLDSGFIEDINAGKSAELDIVFRNKDNLAYIGRFTDIKLTAKVMEKDNFVDVLASETVHIYPFGPDKAVIHQRQPEDSDIILLDNDKLSVTLIGYRSDAAFGLIADIFTVNKMDSTIMLMSEDESVNGLALRPYFGTAVPGGCCAYEKIVWPRAIFEENKIEKVDSLEFRLQACNNKNLFDSYADEPVSLKPDFTV